MVFNRERAVRLVHAEDLAGLMATTPENVFYLTGFWAPTTWRHRAREVYALLPAATSDPPILILPASLADVAAQHSIPATGVYLYGDFTYEGSGADRESAALSDLLRRPWFNTAPEALVSALKDRGVMAGRLGLDELRIALSAIEAMRNAVPQISLVDAQQLFRWIRMVKTPEEVERIGQATAITEDGFKKALILLRPGCTELTLAEAYRAEVVRQGALPMLLCIGAGARSAFPNVQPSSYEIRRGDLVRFDIGCLYRNYHSDIARTAALGDPGLEARALYAAVQAGLGAALSAIRPGNTAAYVFQEAIRGVEDAGIRPYRRPHCGHGEGLEGYDLPLLAPGDATALEPGMVLCVETPYYRLGFGGVHVEETVVVTAGGYRMLSGLPQHLIEIDTA